MTKPQATRSTDTRAPEEPPVRAKTYGDPVIVDDGGSIRIEQRGKKWDGHVFPPTGPGAHPDQRIFHNNSLLCVFSLTANGPLCASVPLQLKDIITVTASADDVTLTLEDVTAATRQNLKVVSTAAADHYPPGAAGHGHEHFHVPSASHITRVTLTRDGTPTVVLDASIHGTASMTFVSVHPA